MSGTTTVQGVPLANFVGQVTPQVVASPFAANGSVLRSVQARAQEVINVKDFGAPGSAGGDSAPGINAAFAYLRGLGTNAVATLVFPADTYTVNSPIDATGLQSAGIVIEGRGSTVVGAFNGGIVFDFFDTRWLKLRDLVITWDGVHEPAIGIAGGSVGTRPADSHNIQNVLVQGNFSLACAYFIATETSAALSLRCVNGDAGAGSYGLIADGINHFGVSSTFAPQTLAADTLTGFNGMLFSQADVRKPNGGHAIWIGGASRHTWQASYVDCATPTQAVVLWASAANTDQSITQLTLDLHQDTTSCTDVFLVDGPNPAPVIQGLSYTDPEPQAGSSIFRTAPQITSVTAQSLTVDIAKLAQSPVLFADSALWTVSGTLISPSSMTLMNVVPSQFTGTQVVPAGVDGSALLVVPRGGEAGRTLAERAAEVVNVKDFGAPGSAGGDSAPGINAALAYVRGLGASASARVVFPADTYTVDSPINATGLQSPGIVIDGCGSAIVGNFNGGIVFDFFDTRFLKLRDLFITNATGFEPALGLAGGNIGTRVADCHVIQNVHISGSFTLACSYFIATETSAAYNLKCWNNDTGTGSYGLIVDACNHFGVSSTFAPQTSLADTSGSFNEMLFEQPDVRKPNGGHAIWMGGGTRRHRYVGGYCDCNTATQAVVLWGSTTDYGFGVNDTYFDVHIENGSCTDAFLVDGATNTPSIYGFVYRDHNPEWTNSAFNCAAHITGVYAQNIEIDIAILGSPQVFLAQPALWTVLGGRFVSPNYAGAIDTAAMAAWRGQVLAGGTYAVTMDAGTVDGALGTTGALSVGGTLTAGGAASLNGGVTTTGLTASGAVSLGNVTIAGGNGLTVTSGDVWSQQALLVGSNTSGFTQMVMGAAAGATRFINIQTAGTPRWNVGANGDAESGGNAGSSYVIARYSDAGGFLDFALSIDRATGDVSLADALAVKGGAGFNGAAPIAKPTVSGAKGGNAALASLMAALAAYGLVTDNTTA